MTDARTKHILKHDYLTNLLPKHVSSSQAGKYKVKDPQTRSLIFDAISEFYLIYYTYFLFTFQFLKNFKNKKYYFNIFLNKKYFKK